LVCCSGCSKKYKLVNDNTVELFFSTSDEDAKKKSRPETQLPDKRELRKGSVCKHLCDLTVSQNR